MRASTLCAQWRWAPVALVLAAFFWTAPAAYARCNLQLGVMNGCAEDNVGVRRGGGGGGNYGAAIGAAGVALGVLGNIIENSNPGGPGSAGPSCRPGYKLTAGGGCIPSGAVDCGNGRYCASGNVCSNGGCLPKDAVQFWRDFDREQTRQKAQNENAAQRELEQIYQKLGPAKEVAAAGASQVFASPNPFASSPERGASAAMPQLFHRLTKQQCSDRGGLIITYTNTAGQGPDVGECFVAAAVSGGGNSLPQATKRGVPPDVVGEIQTLAVSILDMPDNAADRPLRIRKLKRLAADHGVRLKPEDLQCLQPTSGTDAALADVALRWHPYHIKKEAIDRSHLCDGVAEGEAKEACREAKYGEAVMWAEPEIAGQCRTANAPDFDDDAVAACAKSRFLNAWASNDGILPAPTPATWIAPASCARGAPPAVRKNTLRDRLRESFARQDDDASGIADRNEPPSPVLASASVAAEPALEPVAPAADGNEAYCNYMARGVVRGELTPGPNTAIPPECKSAIDAAMALRREGANPFTMNPVETDREVRRLLQPSAAASGGDKSGLR